MNVMCKQSNDRRAFFLHQKFRTAHWNGIKIVMPHLNLDNFSTSVVYKKKR